MKTIAASNWIKFDWNDKSTHPPKYDKYLICRKDGKIHWETWNGNGWTYNQNVIVFWARIINPLNNNIMEENIINNKFLAAIPSGEVTFVKVVVEVIDKIIVDKNTKYLVKVIDKGSKDYSRIYVIDPDDLLSESV